LQIVEFRKTVNASGQARVCSDILYPFTAQPDFRRLFAELLQYLLTSTCRHFNTLLTICRKPTIQLKKKLAETSLQDLRGRSLELNLVNEKYLTPTWLPALATGFQSNSRLCRENIAPEVAEDLS
jgi:hypothetical protein